MPPAKLDEAKRRIARAHSTGAAILDLGDLGLDELPVEITILRDLRVLALGNRVPVPERGDLRWDPRPAVTEYYMADLGPLGLLRGLEYLSLAGCRAVRDLAPVGKLDNLEWLDLTQTAIGDLAPLVGADYLRSLDLTGCSNVNHVGPLTLLPRLARLVLSGTAVDNLEGHVPGVFPALRELAIVPARLSQLDSLEHLSTLEVLALASNVAWDLAPLGGLRRLRQLAVTGAAVADLEALAGLEELTALDLSATEVGDLRPLVNLPQLRRLSLRRATVRDVSALGEIGSLRELDLSGTSVRDLRPLARLHRLEALDLTGTSVRDLEPLARLQGLARLDLGSCAFVSDLAPVGRLANLARLDVGGCRGVRAFAPLRPLLPKLSRLVLFETPFDDLPAEVCGEAPAENVLAAVRAHFADLAHGPAADTELKLFVLGNGRVGKTQLCRRLQGEPFDEDVPTTHGVRLGHLDLDLPGGGPVRLNLWDFGGQDIYHGSHALFLQSQAVFLILWHPGLEQGEYREGGVAIRHRPLSYWLEYVRALAGPDAAVVVIQSQCDAPGTEAKPPADVPSVACSARTGRGLDAVRAALTRAVAESLVRHPAPPIGVGRAAVRDRLRQVGRRTLAIDEFRSLCAEAGPVSDPDAVLAYLHRTGAVFHRPGLFDDRIVLDQQWALDAIYALLHRAETLPWLAGRGRFTRRDLALTVWKGVADADQKTLLSMMESCGVCFRVRDVSPRPDAAEWEYAAPELLPGWDAVAPLLGPALDPTPDAEAAARYRFLHEGILRSFLSRLGQVARDRAIYWRYGCWFHDRTTGASVVARAAWDADGAAGTVTVQARGGRAGDAVQAVLRLLEAVPLAKADEVLRTSPRGDEPFPEVRPDGDRAVLAPAPPGPDDDGGREVFVSYAWGDDHDDAGRLRGAAIDRLCDRLGRDGFRVVRDTAAMRTGDLISGFMLRIGRGGKVVVVLSEKYLRSPYCMTELHLVYQHALGQRDDFLRRVVPLVLADAAFDTWEQRATWSRHWEEQYRRMEHDLRHLGLDDFGRYLLMKRWHADVGTMLGWIADKLTPRVARPDDDTAFDAVADMLS